MISEETLHVLIRKLKENGYLVERDGAATVEGMATGILKIKYYQPNSKEYKVVHKIDLVKVEDVEGILVEKFNL